jgi:hypothetical protein
MRESKSFRTEGANLSWAQVPRRRFSRKGAKAAKKKFKLLFASFLCVFAPLRENPIPAHGTAGDFVLLGLGVPTAKSIALFRVSAQPFAARNKAFVLLAAGAGAEPLKQFAVLP